MGDGVTTWGGGEEGKMGGGWEGKTILGLYGGSDAGPAYQLTRAEHSDRRCLPPDPARRQILQMCAKLHALAERLHVPSLYLVHILLSSI